MPQREDRGRGARRLVDVAAPVAAVLAVLAVWEIWVRLSGTPVYVVPAPSDIAARLMDRPGHFARHGAVTLAEAAAGFALGCAASVAAATVMAHSRAAERTLYPLALLVKVTPVIAVAPLFVIWFGFGSFPKVLIAALITFFPVLVSAIAGFRSVNSGALDFMRSVSASTVEIFLKLRLPSALPYLFAAFRITVPLAVIGAVVGEWFTGDRGLGSVIIVAHNNIDMPTLFAAIVVLAAIGVALTALTAYAEGRTLFWHESRQAQRR
ncbi:MAG: ABC transporter permease [SAR202 cluster bacterium]|nr:ABC transporter permease [SAR202 cluster bacterium]